MLFLKDLREQLDRQRRNNLEMKQMLQIKRLRLRPFNTNPENLCLHTRACGCVCVCVCVCVSYVFYVCCKGIRMHV